MTDTQHIPVLLHESIQGLSLKKGDTLIDATFGAGGHTQEVVSQFGKDIHIIALDRDEDAVLKGKERFNKQECHLDIVHANYTELLEVIKEKGVDEVDAILFDLGTSVDQLKTSGRGFTFEKDESLEMTMGKNEFNARDIVNLWSAETLTTIIKAYGEEQFAWKIAQKIIEKREEKPIETTFELVEIIKQATPKFYHFKKIHPATKTFQALRIAVNDEIQGVQKGIRQAFEILSPGGRISVISFHSLEDREVKRYFRELEDEGLAIRITKKPITPTEEEIQDNRKSRSAKLRITEKI